MKLGHLRLIVEKEVKSSATFWLSILPKRLEQLQTLVEQFHGKDTDDLTLNQLFTLTGFFYRIQYNMDHGIREGGTEFSHDHTFLSDWQKRLALDISIYEPMKILADHHSLDMLCWPLIACEKKEEQVPYAKILMMIPSALLVQSLARLKSNNIDIHLKLLLITEIHRLGLFSPDIFNLFNYAPHQIDHLKIVHILGILKLLIGTADNRFVQLAIDLGGKHLSNVQTYLLELVEAVTQLKKEDILTPAAIDVLCGLPRYSLAGARALFKLYEHNLLFPEYAFALRGPKGRDRPEDIADVIIMLSAMFPDHKPTVLAERLNSHYAPNLLREALVLLRDNQMGHRHDLIAEIFGNRNHLPVIKAAVTLDQQGIPFEPMHLRHFDTQTRIGLLETANLLTAENYTSLRDCPCTHWQINLLEDLAKLNALSQATLSTFIKGELTTEQMEILLDEAENASVPNPFPSLATHKNTLFSENEITKVDEMVTAKRFSS